MPLQSTIMRKTAKFLLALAVALLLMLCFRALAFSICTVEGSGLAPTLLPGDRVLVNRWSYGLRVGGEGGVFSYGRIGRQAVRRGDIVAFEHPENPRQLLLCRCKALPGDTIHQPDGSGASPTDGHPLVMPSVANCADADYYWMEALGAGNLLDSRTLGAIPEHCIIGRVAMVVFNHHPQKPLWKGWKRERTFIYF